MIRGAVVCLVVLALHGVLAQIVPGPIVQTEHGPVQGNDVTMNEPAGHVYSFWNVPYAAPPVGLLRFQVPQAPQPWTEVKYSESYGNACPSSKKLFLLTQPTFNNFDEDCLNLNVFTANVSEEAKAPVMVFFHGGGYTSGGAMQYPGHFLARHGLVIVTVNYRLGHLGFLTTEDAVAPGNYGLYDQNFALRWVRFNIARFGGDPDSVTIFGQSAGAASSSLHMISPKSRGLFHRAIMESGTDFSLWAINWPIQNPVNYTRQVAEQHNCNFPSTQEMVTCLRDVPWQILWNTSFECTEGTFCQGMAPVIDGPAGFIPDHPINLRNAGLINEVPIITGLCREDGSLYTYALLPDTSGGFNRSEFERNLRDHLLVWFTAMFPPEREEDVFNSINWYYSPWPHVDDVYANREAFNFMVTDAGFGYAADAQAKHQSQTSDSYFYVFGFRSTNASRLIPEWMGVPHMGEIPYVFGYPLLQRNIHVRRDTNIVDVIDWNQEDIDYANYFMPMLANFAKYSNPTPEPIVPPTGGPGLIWPPYNGHYRDDLELPYLLVDNVTNIIGYDYRQHAYSFFHEYWPYFAGYEFTPLAPIPPGTESEANSQAAGMSRPASGRLQQVRHGRRHPPLDRTKRMDSTTISAAIDAYIEDLFTNSYAADEFDTYY